MSTSLDQYLELRAELTRLRWRQAGFESKEEDELLAAMDEIWATLSDSELEELQRKPPPRQLTRPPRQVPGQVARIDTDLFASGDAIPPRRLGEVG